MLRSDLRPTHNTELEIIA